MLDNDYSCCISGDDDYGEQNATVTFTPAQTELFVDVTINDDSVLEGNETFQGVLSLPSGSVGVSLGDRLATATILDNDCKSNNIYYIKALLFYYPQLFFYIIAV